MYAVVKVAGHQFRVQEGDKVHVPRLALEEGAKHRIDDVLLVGSEAGIQLGTPKVQGAAVDVTVVGHGRGDKGIVFKMKRRKNYRRRKGHRQDYTQLQIDGIVNN